ncbi:cell wall-active antibiotics response protein LiaF [Loigolactobacillus backii]|uniref:Cell wall-active antibiotics response LiaF-like C-terminal domain-containing protein n=1 Tax=Loigolactobacillus backii TaxID=375175 RepID=A0A192H1Q3_9LACO|nr:cell wall-active antibiotics response protein LiaF [Loigolactobacillus backii]ANK59326.1 hypothetical protein AYR52_03125 [Loigolactobacillus backii]ANK62739.1 hypothetical protein AYR53_08240 [Loigolactobacillus backii]ANK64318.1 hypothetical protein AYR54_03125 [Loigolactobacillus backii]ANK67287.1 hypothetical protein AYR55_05915 [Loigolactobacillus backii]ANK70253.1 hypothetical protein AYR56_08765 [Loigolactobacillus backii]
MQRGSWRLFMIIEASLLIVLGWQIFSNPPQLIFMVLGILSLRLAIKQRHKRFLTSFFWLFGSLAIIITIFTNPTIWVMLLIGLLFTVIKGHDLKVGDLKRAWVPWARKQFVAVETTEPTPKNGKRIRHPWFGNQTIGRDVFEWDDINLCIAIGDTIIDLGNTLLPKADSVIIVRKGIGRTRILVPVGTAVMLDHTAMIGNVNFAGKAYHVGNDELTFYSDDYDTNERRVKILTNVLAGDLEVLFV